MGGASFKAQAMPPAERISLLSPVMYGPITSHSYRRCVWKITPGTFIEVCPSTFAALRFPKVGVMNHVMDTLATSWS